VKLLIIRHGKAEDRSPTREDANRRLTGAGRKAMRNAARGLREVAPEIDVLATSPLARARETAEIVAEAFGIRRIVEQKLLAPEGDTRALIAWLRRQPSRSAVALVGHEPELGALVSLLASGRGQPRIALKKGACCLIEFSRAPAAGKGMLLWLLQPSQLKKLGD
jgi:phosphohistidine phosphatase